jgi:hypothetical protein
MSSIDEILAGHGRRRVLHCLGENPRQVPLRAVGVRAFGGRAES